MYISIVHILSIVDTSIYSSNCPYHSMVLYRHFCIEIYIYISDSLVQRSSIPSLRNHASHILSTPILHPSKMNTRALRYIGPKLWNSPPPYIRSIKSHKTFTKYIQQFIIPGNL